eukprot:12725694-Alexandrium_andersonii.AAC.1
MRPRTHSSSRLRARQRPQASQKRRRLLPSSSPPPTASVPSRPPRRSLPRLRLDVLMHQLSSGPRQELQEHDIW